jgi:hypothetical protein
MTNLHNLDRATRRNGDISFDDEYREGGSHSTLVTPPRVSRSARASGDWSADVSAIGRFCARSARSAPGGTRSIRSTPFGRPMGAGFAGQSGRHSHNALRRDATIGTTVLTPSVTLPWPGRAIASASPAAAHPYASHPTAHARGELRGALQASGWGGRRRETRRAGVMRLVVALVGSTPSRSATPRSASSRSAPAPSARSARVTGSPGPRP